MLNEALVLRLIDLAIEKGPDAWFAVKKSFADQHRSIEETVMKLEKLPPAYERKHDVLVDDLVNNDAEMD